MAKTRKPEKDVHNDDRKLPGDKRKVKTTSMKRKLRRCINSKLKRAKEMDTATRTRTSQIQDECGSGISPPQFQKLLKERKTEYQRQLRVKLKKEVQRLKAMAADPGPVAKQSHQVELWTKLFDTPLPEDDSSTLFINPLYNEDTERNRVRDVLLPQMLHFNSPFVKNLRECPIWDPTVMQLRQVSRSMPDAMERCFNDQLEAAMWNNKSSVSRTIRKPIKLFMPYNPEPFNQILKIKPPLMLIRKEMEVTIKSPSKMTSYKNPSLSYLQHFRQFKNNVTLVLKQVGDQIQSFEFTFGEMAELERYGVSLTHIYLVLMEWLGLLPNLKWLKNVVVGGESCTSGEVIAPATATVKVVDEAILRHQPPPTLESLVRLDFTVKTDHDFAYCAIGDIIAATNPHIQILHFHGNDFHRWVPHSCIEWLQLESLILEGHLYNEPMEFLRSLNSPDSRWNLRNLTLSVDMKGAPVNVLFEYLNKLPGLENLTLAVGSITIGGEIDFLWLRKLKKFSFEFDPIIFQEDFNENAYLFFSLQFLLYSSKLESITWKNLGRDSGQLQRDIELHWNVSRKGMVVGFKEGTGFNHIYDAVLRDIFPYLKEICVECCGVTNKKKWELYDEDDSEAASK